MNEVSQVEERLQSWTLRRPSEHIKRALFTSRKVAAVAPSEGTRRRSGGFVPGILPLAAPAMACFMAVLTITGPNGFERSPQRSAAMFASVSSNAFDGALNADDFFFVKTDNNLDRNVWLTATFEWTNRWVSSSSNGSLPLAKTNGFR